MNSNTDSNNTEIESTEKECLNDQIDNTLVDFLGKPIKLNKEAQGPQIGEIVDLNNDGRIMVTCPAYSDGPIHAQLTSTVRDRIVHQKLQAPLKVLLVYENSRPECPIIIDTLHTTTAESTVVHSLDVEVGLPQAVTVDGKRVTFNAHEEIVLRCGKASIILTSEGRVIIRGAHVMSRSTGPNKIKGGSVQIN